MQQTTVGIGMQYLGDLGCSYIVYTNDSLTVDELRALNPSGILVSPGPGMPHCVSSNQNVLQSTLTSKMTRCK